jgi:hypothetical protein
VLNCVPSTQGITSLLIQGILPIFSAHQYSLEKLSNAFVSTDLDCATGFTTLLGILAN